MNKCFVITMLTKSRSFSS